jgi:uncharacterized phage protein (TIGR01671 family)
MRMRKIKFRAFERNLKEIIPVHNIDFEKRMINIESAWRFFDEIELMQYTGLKDKNGKEIYEGDILKVPVDINQEIHGNYSLHDVLIKKGVIITNYVKSEKGQILPKGYTAGFLLDSYGFDNKSFLFNDEPLMGTEIEVIGNIYDNPELLEGGQ